MVQEVLSGAVSHPDDDAAGVNVPELLEWELEGCLAVFTTPACSQMQVQSC